MQSNIKGELKQTARLFHDDRKFALQTLTGLLLVRQSEVIYFQHNDNLRHWQVYLTEDRVFKLRTNITAKHILGISASFFQMSQFIIVNVDYVESIDTQLHCVFHPPYNHLNIVISRRYYQQLKENIEII